MNEEQNERRLAREAQQLLGVLHHPDARRDGTDSGVHVEVYDPVGDRAGHFKVVVPTIDVDPDDPDALASHPATLAEDVMAEREDGYEVVDTRAW